VPGLTKYLEFAASALKETRQISGHTHDGVALRRKIRPQLTVARTALLLQTLHSGSRLSAFLSEVIGSALKGGVKVCQRQLVKEMIGLLVTECALDSAHQGATPNQRALQGGFLVRI
jgi:hypothetical protein